MWSVWPKHFPNPQFGKFRSTGDKHSFRCLFTWSSGCPVICYVCLKRGWLLHLHSRCCLTECCHPGPLHLDKDTNTVRQQLHVLCTAAQMQLQSDLNIHAEYTYTFTRNMCALFAVTNTPAQWPVYTSLSVRNTVFDIFSLTSTQNRHWARS